MGADTLRVEVKWNEVAPLPSARTKPGLRRDQPGGVSGLRPVRRPDPARAGARDAGDRHDHRRRSALGDRGGRGRSFATANWKVSAGEYGRFATAVAKRYSGRFGGLPAVNYFTIWNEPNHRNFLKPTSARAGRVPQDGRHRAAADPPQRPERRADLRRRAGARRPRAGLDGTEGVLPQVAVPEQDAAAHERRSACRHFKRIDADGFAHHPYGPTARVPRDAT